MAEELTSTSALFTKFLLGENGVYFGISVKLGTNTFTVNSRKGGTNFNSDKPRKKKYVSPSTRKRDKRRLENFLDKKKSIKVGYQDS